MGGARRQQGSTKVEIARQEQRTVRTLARAEALRGVGKAVAAAAAAVGVAWQIAGKQTGFDVNIVLGLTMFVTLPPGVVKIFWDRRQKERQRERLVELEGENTELRTANAD